jgi:hypothetical protein
MMGVVEKKWVSSMEGAGFAWEILVDLFFSCWSLVGISYTHHLFLHKIDMI